MNILYIVNYFPPLSGAAAINSKKIAEHLINLGNNVMVLAPNDMGKVFDTKDPSSQYVQQNFNIKC